MIENIYFVGIGGIGMSALARYFKLKGKIVAGYDRTPTEITDSLAHEGIAVHFTDDVNAIPLAFKNPENTLVVYTPAIPKNHSELCYFQQNGYQVLKRSEVLGHVTNDSFCFAVAGTHSRTTTSSILVHILVESGTSVSAFLGGIAENFNSNIIIKGSDYTVVEADEFDRSFLRLSPNIACITSMDADHLDIYGDAAHLIEGFGEFAKKIKKGGSLILRNGLTIEGLEYETYGLDDDADYTFRNIRVIDGIYHFDFHYQDKTYRDYTFAKPGRHNLLNALVAVSMAVKGGFDAEKLLPHLATFKGVKRRFSYIVKEKDFVFIDDYAHHPSEINALYQAVAEMYPHTPKTIIFQPHLFTRTRDFADGFAKSLSQFDRVLLLDIYPARELPIEGVTSQWLLDNIANPNKMLLSKSEIINYLQAHPARVLVLAGAGDIGVEVEKIKKFLEKDV